MQATKRKKLEQHGWKVGSADEFLNLTSEETAYIEMELALSSTLKKHGLKWRPDSTFGLD